MKQTVKYVDFYHRNALSYSSYINCLSILLITSNLKQKIKIKRDLLRNSNQQARLIETFHLRESRTCSKIQRVCYSLQEGPLNQCFGTCISLPAGKYVAVCDMHCVQYMVLSKQSPKSVLDKKKCILVILFAKSFTFSSSWYCPINYPNQRRMKNKHLILAILFTKNCTFSKSLFPVHSTFQPITQISAE